jgi:hypothetical protein
MHVGHEAPLETEEWTLKVTRVARQGAEFDFELYGSRTGPDGAGSNTKPFRSRSGRVTLQPSDYDVERSIGLHKIAMPYDWQIRWSTLPRFRDPVLPAAGAQTILYGLPPGPHTVVLTAPPGQRLPPLRLRSYAPPLVVK